MTERSKRTTNTRIPIENHEHGSDSRANPARPTGSVLSYPQLRRVVGVGLLAVATVVLFGVSLPLTPLPSSLAVVAALLLALGTLLVGVSPISRSTANTTVQASPTSDEETRVR